MIEDAYEIEAATNEAESFFDAPAIEVPPAVPEAHRATVTSVEGKVINDNWVKVQVNIVSRDVPTVERSMEILIPKAYTDSFASGAKFDPTTLPSNAQTSYRIGTSNSDYTATLQTLVFNVAGARTNSAGKQITVKDSVARQCGRSLSDLGISKPRSFEDYVDAINKMLQGLEVIALLKERGGNDPAFSHRLEVKEILAADAYDTNPKKFRNYQLAWENA